MEEYTDDIYKKSHKVICEMLQDREIDGVEEIPEFDNLVGEIHKYFIISDIIVVFLDLYKIGANEVPLLQNFMDVNSLNHGIFIYQFDITPAAKPMISLLQKNNYTIELFSLTETQINWSKHRLVPFHEIVSDKERREIIKSYKVNNSLNEELGEPTKFPKIPVTDPQIRYIGGKKRQMVKIHRSSNCLKNNKTFYYRIID